MALLGKFGIGGALEKILDSGDIESPKVEPALEKLLDNKKEAMEKVIEKIRSGPRIHYTTSLELLELLLDNSTVEVVLEALPKLESSKLHDVATALNTSHQYDPHIILPYMKEPLSLGICRDMIMAHRKEFTAAKLLRAAARTKPDLWDIIFELVHGRTDEAAFPEAIALTKSKNATLREYATGVIAEYNNPAATDALLSMLRDNDRNVYLAALSGLVRIKSSMPAAPLFQLMQNMQKDDAHLIKALISYCEDPQLMKYLNKALFGKNNKQRTMAMQALGSIASVDNIRLVFQELAQKAEVTHASVIQTLFDSIGEKLLDAIVVLVDDSDPKISSIALKAADIYDPGNPRIAELMRRLVSGDIPADIQHSFIEKLGNAHDKDAVQVLIKILRSQPKQRVATLKALEKIGDESALADVFEMLGDKDVNIQVAALACLARIIPKKFASQIREQLIANADKLNDEALSHLVMLLEKITSQHRLPETTAYTNAMEKLKADSSEDFESYAAPVMEPAGAGAGGGDPFGTTLSNPFDSGESDVFGTGELLVDDLKDEEPKEPEMDLQVGQVFNDRYKLVNEIGRGGYGSVWLVEDTFIQEQLVMKFLHQTLVADEVAIERFVRELRLARKITHTNIIRLFDYLTLGNYAIISMEYFPGKPLSHIIHQGIMEPSKVIKLCKIICAALGTAHEVDVIHRDMKPANILVDENDVVKIVDFGIAAASKHAESRLTRTGTLVGTPTYISPEQIQGKAVDGRTDMYSLGVIMYEMLSGQPPYRAEDPMALVFMHVEGNARRLDELNPTVPKALADVVHRCLEPDPDNRYQNMAELDQALSEVDLG